MASVTVKYLLNMVEDILQDDDNDHWSLTNLINWYNLCQRQLVKLVPEANPVTDKIKLASGTLQAIPARGLALIDVTRNMGTDGQTAGEAITLTTIEALQAYDRSWNTATAVTAISNFMPSPRNPKRWYCYPPSDGNGYVELIFSQVPPQIVYDAEGNWEANLVGVADDFVDDLINAILARCYQKDSDYPGNQDRALAYIMRFCKG